MVMLQRKERTSEQVLVCVRLCVRASVERIGDCYTTVGSCMCVRLLHPIFVRFRFVFGERVSEWSSHCACIGWCSFTHKHISYRLLMVVSFYAPITFSFAHRNGITHKKKNWFCMIVCEIETRFNPTIQCGRTLKNIHITFSLFHLDYIEKKTTWEKEKERNK